MKRDDDIFTSASLDIPIHRRRESVRASLSQFNADNRLVRKAEKIARDLSYSVLVLFWLEAASRESDTFFINWLNRIGTWSKQDLINIFYELGTTELNRFVERFGKQ